MALQNFVRITFDPAKRDRTLRERGLDFADASAALDGDTATVQDCRFDYGEVRYITAGYIGERMVVIVWTPRGDARHIISMRHAHAREQAEWHRRMDRP